MDASEDMGLDDFTKGWAISDDEVNIGLRKAAVEEHSDELLKDWGAFGIWLDGYSISRNKSTNNLKSWDLQWEVPGGYNSHWSKRPSITLSLLSLAITTHTERLHAESN